MRRIAYYLLPAALFVTAPSALGEPPGQGNVVTIKIATVAPEGSAWMDIAHEYEAAVKKLSGGRVKFVWFTGGVMGDEPEMVRKIKLGQLQGGAFSGMGLGKIVPAVRVLELPLLFKNYDEVDYVLGKLDKTFRKLFEDRGYVLAGWGEQGFIYVFTNKPVYRIEDLNGVKMWVWAGDTFAKTIFDSIGYLTPVPIALPEVLTSLETGLINAFYNPPLGAVALQWYLHVKYMLTVPITYGTGAVVLDKKTFDTYPADIRNVLMDEARKVFPKLLVATRRDNAQFIKNFPKQGVELIDPDPKLVEDLQKKMEIAYKNLTGEFVPEWLLTGVRQALYEVRFKK